MIFNIAKKAGQIEKTMQKEKTKKLKKETEVKVISTEDVSIDCSTGTRIEIITQKQMSMIWLNLF